MFFVSFRTSSLFHEKRLIFFAKEKHDIPVPSRCEDFENSLYLCRSERDAFRKKYRQSLEALPHAPAIATDVLRSFPEDEAERVFEALQSESSSPENVLLLRTHRSTERGYARCRQEVHEQTLLLNALKDVRKMQTLL